MAETIGGRRAGLYAAAACTLNATLTYYGQVTNLDGPYLFWSALSLWGWMRAIAEREPRHLRWAALSAAAAVATKDQAYAVFLISVPLALLLWLAVDRQASRQSRCLRSTARSPIPQALQSGSRSLPARRARITHNTRTTGMAACVS
jgi:4-amino-4-deoxy-L-arabinose transferase-like glycosyltransferase